MTTLSTFILIVSLFLGGTGATVAAAQNSLPDQPLYAVKLASEDVRAGLTAQQQSKLDLALEFANERINEAEHLASTGTAVPQTVLARYQQETQKALSVSAGMDDAALHQALLRIQAHLQAQLAALDQLPAAVQAEPALARIRTMLTDRLRLVELGLTDPQAFREQLRQGWNSNPGYPPPAPSVTRTMGAGMGNPWTTGTPTPGSGYGPMPTHEPEMMATSMHTEDAGHNDPGPMPTQMMNTTAPHHPEPGGMGLGPQPTQPASASTQPAATPVPQQPDPGGMGPGPMPTHEPEHGGVHDGGGGGMHH